MIKTSINKNKEDEDTNTISLKSNKTIKGERSIAISWEGYDDLILGKVRFSERDLMGVMVFTLPNDEDCIGTYVPQEKRDLVNLL